MIVAKCLGFDSFHSVINPILTSKANTVFSTMLSQSPPAILFERSPIILPTHKKATLPQRVSVQSLSSTQPDDLRLEKQDTYARLSATSKLPNTGSESDTYSLSRWLLEEGPLERLGVSGTLLDARHLQRPRPSPLSKPANSSFIGKKIQDMDNPVSYLAHIGSWCDDVKL